MEANRLFESSLTLVLKLRNLDVCWRKMMMFYFIREDLTIFKNKSKGLAERKIVKRITFLWRDVGSFTPCVKCFNYLI